MTEKVALITDSSCDASNAELRAMGVECVQLKVTRPDGGPFDQDNTPENIELFYDYIATCDALPTTSQATPLDFSALYARLAREGYTHAISMHIGSKLSGTVETARLAAANAPLEVEVIDTRTATVAQYLFVRRIAQLRDAGHSFAQLVDVAHRLEGKTSVCFMLDTLRNLVMGGRAGKAVGLAAALLNIKPLLTVAENGEIVILAKTKSVKRAAGKLADIAAELTDKFGELEICLMHTRRPDGLELLASAFENSGLRYREVPVRQPGPVITTHVSCGAIGFSYIPVEV